MNMLNADQKEKYWKYIIKIKEEEGSLKNKKQEADKHFEGITTRSQVEIKLMEVDSLKVSMKKWKKPLLGAFPNPKLFLFI